MRSKFKLGDLIAVQEPIDVSCRNITIDKGERGKVIDVDPDTKDLTIRICGDYPELACRRNCIALRANEAHKIKRIGQRRYLPKARTFLYAAGLFALFVVPGDRLLWQFIQAASANRPAPVTFQNYSLITNKVRAFDPNGHLEFRGERLEARACVFRWTHIFVRAKTGDIVAEEQNDGRHISPVGKIDIYDFSIKVPDFLEPGDYILKNAATMDCDGGDVVNYFQEPARFTVVPPNQLIPAEQVKTVQ